MQKQPCHPRASFDLLIHVLLHVRRSQTHSPRLSAQAGRWRPEYRQAFRDVCLQPVGRLGCIGHLEKTFLTQKCHSIAASNTLYLISERVIVMVGFFLNILPRQEKPIPMLASNEASFILGSSGYFEEFFHVCFARFGFIGRIMDRIPDVLADISRVGRASRNCASAAFWPIRSRRSGAAATCAAAGCC